MIELVYGGSGSGKSGFAEARLEALSARSKSSRIYLATMIVCDDEMRKKVLRHNQMRAGKGFVTVERPLDISLLENDIASLGADGVSVLLECMSNLVANEMFRDKKAADEETVARKITADIEKIVSLPALRDLVIVSNNIFDDGADYDETSRAYMRSLSRLNCMAAEMADRVTEVAAGIPLEIKRR